MQFFQAVEFLKTLSLWAEEESPKKATVHVIVVATHEGFWYNREELIKVFKKLGKEITLVWYPSSMVLENRKYHKNISDVLFPIKISGDPIIDGHIDCLNEEAQKLIEAGILPKNFSLVWREPGRKSRFGTFSSEEGRQTLEREFLKKGIFLLENCPNLKGQKRALGYMHFVSFGFGSPIVTFRNCPNNAPLALWVGNSEGKPWYPLFPREPNRVATYDRKVE